MQTNTATARHYERAACRHFEAYLQEVATDADSALLALATLHAIVVTTVAFRFTKEVMAEIAQAQLDAISETIE